MSLLDARNVICGYGHRMVLDSMSVNVEAGEGVSLLGHNGTGKSTLIRAISGVIPVKSGEILFEGKPVANLTPDALVKRGIVHVPAGRRIFPNMSVEHNLEAGAFTRTDRQEVWRDIEAMMERFPILGERRGSAAGLLSGGEQQVLAVARGLMARPKLLMVDEPSLGLSPTMVQFVFGILAELRKDGTSVVLAEQNVRKALAVTDRAYVLAQGRVIMEGPSESLLSSEAFREDYLGAKRGGSFGELVEEALDTQS